MFIKCWGSRGSIPVSGKEYIKYGGDTTCIEIRTKDDKIIIIDAGTGIRRLGNKLIEEERYDYHLIFTHAHWDHIMGFPYFKPLFLKNTRINVYRCPFPENYVEKMMTRIMTPPGFPVKYSNLQAKIIYKNGCPKKFNIGTVSVKPILLSHPNGGSGYKFTEDGKTFVFLTDNELGYVHPGGLEFDEYVKFSSNSDLLIHDAEYTPQEYKNRNDWGHSVYTDVIKMAIKADVKKLGLFHLNQERSDREMDDIVRSCHKTINKNGHHLECFAVSCDMAFEL